MQQVPNISPRLPSVVSQKQDVHSVSLKDRKQHAPQNHATTTMSMIIIPNISSIYYIQQNIYHNAHANQQKG